jgi:hypothetical protein
MGFIDWDPYVGPSCGTKPQNTYYQNPVQKTIRLNVMLDFCPSATYQK